MEWPDVKNLDEYIGTTDYGGLSWFEKLQLAKGIADGINCLHNNQILHHDPVSTGCRKMKMAEKLFNQNSFIYSIQEIF